MELFVYLFHTLLFLAERLNNFSCRLCKHICIHPSYTICRRR